MQITILELDLFSPQPVLGGTAVGFPCRFTSNLGGGEALFSGQSARGEGQQAGPIEVRLQPESIVELRPLAAQKAGQPSLTPACEPGDFDAVGKLTSILWLDDEQENGFAEILIGDELLSVPLESDVSDLTYGEWVSFRMRRLVLLAD